MSGKVKIAVITDIHFGDEISIADRLGQIGDILLLRTVHRLNRMIQPDITQCGGILEVKKIASTAESYSIMVAPHNVGGVISTMAALHLCLTLRNTKILEHFNDFADPHVKNAGDYYPEVVDGYFPVPDKPGWGVEINEEFIANNPPDYINGVIADPGLNMFENANWAERGQEG